MTGSAIQPLPPGEQPPAQSLSPWLQLMLAEIARKREELEQARAEQLRRAAEEESSRARSETRSEILTTP